MTWGIVIGPAVLVVGYIGYMFGCHRYPPSSPKFKVEARVVDDALMALTEMQEKRNAHERSRLLAAFGYPENWK